MLNFHMSAFYFLLNSMTKVFDPNYKNNKVYMFIIWQKKKYFVIVVNSSCISFEIMDLTSSYITPKTPNVSFSGIVYKITLSEFYTTRLKIALNLYFCGFTKRSKRVHFGYWLRLDLGATSHNENELISSLEDRFYKHSHFSCCFIYLFK